MWTQTKTKTPPQTEEKEAVKEPISPPDPKKKKAKNIYPYLLALCLLIALIGGVFLGRTLRGGEGEPPSPKGDGPAASDLPAFILPALIEKDGQSRTGQPLSAVRDIAVHYVANPGTGAMANRDYFNGPDSDTSSHLIVGLQGEVLLCVPLNEKSHATGERNGDTISVEVCHPDETGRFSDETYESLVRLLAWLCDRYGLTEENLIRHYDVTGKLCPRYYVEHPKAWEALRRDVKEEREKDD